MGGDWNRTIVVRGRCHVGAVGEGELRILGV